MEKFVKEFTEKKIENVVKIKNKYFLLDKDEREIFEKIPLDAESVGIFLGEEKRNEFSPSLALLDILSKISDRKMVIDEKSAWLFLCGRDVMGHSVVSSNVEDGLVLLQDKNDRNLGYGRIIANLKRRNDTIVVKNILDRGDYLRREMDGKKKR